MAIVTATERVNLMKNLGKCSMELHDANKVHKLLKFKACELNKNQKNGMAIESPTEHVHLMKNLGKRSCLHLQEYETGL